VERFWSKTIQDKNTGCINWIAAKDSCGYGSFRIGNKTYHANRVAYELANGEFDKSLHVLHKCDNPSCVNPNHLFLGTHQDNMTDMSNKKRLPDRRGMLNNSAKLTEKDVLSIRSFIKTKLSQREIAAIFGVHQVQISSIKHGHTWGHLQEVGI
jgi:hypothetical protein